MNDLASVEAALAALPIDPQTDHDITERTRLATLRGDLISARDRERLARDRARSPQPWWVAVKTSASTYYPADGSAPYVASGRGVIMMEPAHARALLTSSPEIQAIQDADLVAQLFPPTSGVRS